MQAEVDTVRRLADGDQVVRFEQRKRVGLGEARARRDAFEDRGDGGPILRTCCAAAILCGHNP